MTNIIPSHVVLQVYLDPDKDPNTNPHYTELVRARDIGKLEVSCPWWADGHYEYKLQGDLHEGCTYRILK